MTDPFENPNPHRLYRDPSRAMIGGVCAGIAAYFGVEAWKVRLIAVAVFLIGFGQIALVYIALWIFLKPRPRRMFETPEDERFWRVVATRPDDAFAATRHRFRDLDKRLARLERHVTSEEFKLNSAFRELK